MANDLFGLGNLGGALNGLVSGLAKSGLAPQDDPAVRLINAQSDVSELQQQEEAILIDIGRQAFAREEGAWPQADKLNLIRANLATAQEKLATLKQQQEEERLAQEAEERAREAAEAVGACPSCGHHNAEGVRFCQECGTKLGTTFCVSCGVEMQPGVRFCGSCGTKQFD